MLGKCDRRKLCRRLCTVSLERKRGRGGGRSSAEIWECHNFSMEFSGCRFAKIGNADVAVHLGSVASARSLDHPLFSPIITTCPPKPLETERDARALLARGISENGTSVKGGLGDIAIVALDTQACTIAEVCTHTAIDAQSTQVVHALPRSFHCSRSIIPLQFSTQSLDQHGLAPLNNQVSPLLLQHAGNGSGSHHPN